jgi:hypothetical protein
MGATMKMSVQQARHKDERAMGGAMKMGTMKMSGRWAQR